MQVNKFFLMNINLNLNDFDENENFKNIKKKFKNLKGKKYSQKN